MDNVDLQIADGHLVAVDQPAVGLERLALHAETLARRRQPLDPEAVVLMRPLDRHAKLLREHTGLPAMVHMAVGDEDLFDLDPRLADRLAQLGQIAAGIDKRALVGFGAPEQGAILLEGGNRDDGGLERRIGSIHVPDVGKCDEDGKSARVRTYRSVIVSPSTFTLPNFAK